MTAAPCDVLLCVAGNGKHEFASRLYKALRDRRLRVLMDRRSLQANGGARAADVAAAAWTAPVGLFLLSGSFVDRDWPKRELQAFLERRDDAGVALRLVLDRAAAWDRAEPAARQLLDAAAMFAQSSQHWTADMDAGVPDRIANEVQALVHTYRSLPAGVRTVRTAPPVSDEEILKQLHTAVARNKELARQLAQTMDDEADGPDNLDDKVDRADRAIRADHDRGPPRPVPPSAPDRPLSAVSEATRLALFADLARRMEDDWELVATFAGMDPSGLKGEMAAGVRGRCEREGAYFLAQALARHTTTQTLINALASAGLEGLAVHASDTLRRDRWVEQCSVQ